MFNCHDHDCSSGSSSVYQTLDELDFERGTWYAAQHGDLQRITKLLGQGIHVDKRDNAGYTALHYSARHGHVPVCNYLLANGADVNATTKSGLATPLHRAASAGKHEVVQLLLQHKADIKLKDSDGKTVLHRAAESQHKNICQLILETCPALKTELDLKGNIAFNYVKDPELTVIFQ